MTILYAAIISHFDLFFQPCFRAFFSSGEIRKRGFAARPDRPKPPVTCAPMCGRAIRGRRPPNGSEDALRLYSRRALRCFSKETGANMHT